MKHSGKKGMHQRTLKQERCLSFMVEGTISEEVKPHTSFRTRKLGGRGGLAMMNI